MPNSLPRFLVHSVALLALCTAGCGEKSTVESFTPSKDIAREALTTALDAWQKGQAKPGEVEDAEINVQVADPQWAQGAKLKSYEIVESQPGDSPRKFTVKLTLEGEATPSQRTYVVVGKDPLWVMPEDEYNRSSGM